MSKGVTYLNPPNAPPPSGMYSHVARATAGELAFIAGQVAVDGNGNIVGKGDFAEQVRQVFENIGAVLKDLGTDFESVVQFTTYVTDAQHVPVWISTRNEIYPRLYPGGKYPPNTFVVVQALVRPEFLVEIQTIAKVPG